MGTRYYQTKLLREINWRFITLLFCFIWLWNGCRLKLILILNSLQFGVFNLFYQRKNKTKISNENFPGKETGKL